MKPLGILGPVVAGVLVVLTYLLVQGATPETAAHERTLNALRTLILNDAAVQRDVLNLASHVASCSLSASWAHALRRRLPSARPGQPVVTRESLGDTRTRRRTARPWPSVPLWPLAR